MESRSVHVVKPSKPSLTIHEQMQKCMEHQQHLNNIMISLKENSYSNRVQLRKLKKMALNIMENIAHDHDYSTSVPTLPPMYYSTTQNNIHTRHEFDSDFEEFLNEIM